jgi:predicted phosphodiesterase
MRVAALYDIHGNVPALEAVLGEVRGAGVDAIVLGGDVVPGPMPREALALLLALDVPVHALKGNGEVAVLSQLAGGEPAVPEQVKGVIRWVAGELTSDQRAALEGWPMTVRLAIDGIGDVLFCHATPRNENEIFTRRTPEERLAPVFAGANAALVVCGHTHMQFDRRVGRTRVVNSGSVGMPFGVTGANWLLLGPTVELRHTAYDLQRAARLVRATSYPQAEDFAARNVLQPPTEEEMLDRLAPAEIR